ncbi:MAG TPA: Gfo/Idh/MocA family oxidoreductase [Chthonomonadaceae bacterium]|nr:Gfo/Idh/MocA family oxidoreductase [Chthonomonadaceae bacterium]
MAELTVGVVGCGGAGQVHLSCWANLSGVRIAAVCDRDGVMAARTVLEYEGAAAFTRVEDLLGAGPLDIVDVCTPPDQQAAIATAALNAGANVLCETPFTGQPDAAASLVALAASRERLLMPAFCHRFHPPLLFAKELLDNDDIGRPVMFRCRFSGYWSEVDTRKLASEERLAQGALMNTAIHGIDLFRYLCGEVDGIAGKLLKVNPELSVEDTAVVALEGRSAVGVVETSWSTPGGRNVVEIYGSAGACLIDYDEGTLRYLTADQPVWRHHEESGLNRFEREIAHFADAVRGLQPLRATGEDGARAVALCAEVYRQNGRA